MGPPPAAPAAPAASPAAPPATPPSPRRRKPPLPRRPRQRRRNRRPPRRRHRIRRRRGQPRHRPRRRPRRAQPLRLKHPPRRKFQQRRRFPHRRFPRRRRKRKRPLRPAPRNPTNRNRRPWPAAKTPSPAPADPRECRSASSRRPRKRYQRRGLGVRQSRLHHPQRFRPPNGSQQAAPPQRRGRRGRRKADFAFQQRAAGRPARHAGDGRDEKVHRRPPGAEILDERGAGADRVQFAHCAPLRPAGWVAAEVARRVGFRRTGRRASWIVRPKTIPPECCGKKGCRLNAVHFRAGIPSTRRIARWGSGAGSWRCGLLLAASKIFRKKPCILPNLGESGLAGSLHLGPAGGGIVVS